MPPLPYAALSIDLDGQVLVWSDGDVIATLPLQDACRVLLAHEALVKELSRLREFVAKEVRHMTPYQDEQEWFQATYLDPAIAALALAKGE